MLSIVIPTFNRSEQLRKLVESIFEQSYTDFEIIVSNDGSSDNTTLVVKELQAKHPGQITYSNGKNEGRANARNKGAALVKGELILFFDDDVAINPQTIVEHVSFHHTYKGENIIADGPALYDMAKLKEDFHFWRAAREHSWYIKTSKPVLKDHAGLVGANKSMKTSFFKKIGGLKQGLNDSEDFELAYRAMHDFGAKIYTLYNAWVYHEDYKNLKEYIARYRPAMISAKKLYMEYPEIVKNYPSRWVFDPPFHMRFLAPFFSKSSIINFTSSKFFQSFPKFLRWKVYEWIVTSYAWYTI